jgi:hypothetical protein
MSQFEATDAELAVARVREILRDPDLKDSWLSVTTRVLARDIHEAVGNHEPDPYATAAENILSEAVRARRKFAPFNSAHEGYAVIAEELDELWDDVKANRNTEEHMISEAIQVGAMAIRFVADMRAKGLGEQAATA